MRSINGVNTYNSEAIQKFSFSSGDHSKKSDSNVDLDKVLESIKHKITIKPDNDCQLSFISNEQSNKNRGTDTLINKLKKRISGRD